MAESKTATPSNVYEALAEFQKDIPVVTKGGKADTGKYSYDYATLDALTPIVVGGLAKMGVAYTTAPTVREDGIFVLRAMLVHAASDTKIEADYPLGNPNAPAQAIGSAITYARRYALLAMTGVAPVGEDDDGAKASEASAKSSAPAAPAKETAESVREEMGLLVGNAEASKVTGEDANAIMEEIAPGKTPNQWTLTELKQGRDKLKALSATRKKG